MKRLADLVLSAILLLAPFNAVLGETVEGVLLTSAGEVAAGEQLVFVNTSTQEQSSTGTDEKGHFHLNLPFGEYSVFRKDPSGTTFISRFSADQDQGRQVTLRLPGGGVTSLTAIRDYEIGLDSLEGGGFQDLADLINPFPARRQGRIYGSLYEFHRNDNFDARNFFDPVGEALPEYKRNQFGVTIGFILSPEMSFQGSYDGLRIIQGSTLLSHLPTQAMKSGDFSELETPIIDPLTGAPFPGNQIPRERIHEVSSRVLPKFEDPNREDPDRNYVNNDPRVRNQDTLAFRYDYDLERNSKLSVDYKWADIDQSQVNRLPSFNSDRIENYQDLTMSYNQALSDRLVTNLRLDFDRRGLFRLSRNSGNSGLLESIGIKGVSVDDPVEEGYPAFLLTGYADPGDRRSPNTSTRNRAGLDLSLTYALNSHTLRAGFEVGARQLNDYRSGSLRRGEFNFTGNFTGDSFADFLLGNPDSAYRALGSDRVDLRRKRWDLFVRDQWKISPNFDFTYGVSYRYVAPYRSIANNVSGFFPLLFEPPQDGNIVVAGTTEASALGFDAAGKGSLVFPDRNDWAPRLGFSFSPLGNNRLMLRGTYSIWYDSPDEWVFTYAQSRNYPFYSVESVDSSLLRPEIDLEAPFNTGVQPEMTIRGIDPGLSSPYVHYWRLAIQNEVARNWNLEVTYAGRKGTNSIRRIPGNIPLPGPESIQQRRPNPEYGKFSIIDNGGAFTGHLLDLSAERRLSQGVSVRSGFAWNRVISDMTWRDPSNPRDLRSERADVEWLARKRFFLNYIIDLPFTSLGPFADASGWLGKMVDGWRLSGITEIRNGRPFTVGLSGDPNNDGVYGDRPDRLSSGTLDPSIRSIDQWFDTAAFAEPDQYDFGNAGRNLLLGPGFQSWDVSVIKQTRLSDGKLVEFRLEFFNAFNNVNFQQPSSILDSSTYGKIFGADRAREIELALKYSF